MEILEGNNSIFLKEYSWEENGITYFCSDDAKYINHSLNNNLEVKDINVYILKANKYIDIGEELTENYLETYDITNKINMLEFLK
jgi:SET domain-containing protein